MTQDYVFSKQTQKELTKLFTRTLTVNGLETIKLNKDEIKDLIFGLNQVITLHFDPQESFIVVNWLIYRFQGIKGTATLAQNLFRDNYRKSITNKTEAQLISQAIRAIIGATPMFCCEDCARYASHKH